VQKAVKNRIASMGHQAAALAAHPEA